MLKSIIAATILASLGGCTGLAGLSALNPGQVSGTAAGIFGIPAATVSTQVVSEIVELQGIVVQLQMLRAQLDGTIPIIAAPVVVPSPTPMTPAPSPVVVPAPAPNPTLPGPVVTPSLLRRGAASEVGATALLNTWQLP